MRAGLVVPLLLVSALPLSSSAAPDDALPDWAAYPSVWPPTPGVSANVSVWILNLDDDCDIPSIPFELDLLMDGVLLERAQIGPIAPCADMLYQSGVPYIGEAGVHELAAVVDPRGAIAEANESNNVRSQRRLFATERPDLVVRVTEIETNSWPLTRVRFHWEVCNVGTAAALADWELSIWMSAPDENLELAGRLYRGPLEAGACSSGVMNGNASPEVNPFFPEDLIWEPIPLGDYRYRAEVYQTDGFLAELDFWNNREDGTFYVGPPFTCEFPPETFPCT